MSRPPRRTLADRRARFDTGDASALAFDGHFDVAVSDLMLNFLDEPAAALDGMQRR